MQLSEHESDAKAVGKWFMGTAIMCMLSSNVFFIKRLIDKIDSTEQTVYALREEIATMKAQINEAEYRRKWRREQ